MKRICSPETPATVVKPKEVENVILNNTLKVSSKFKSVLEEKFVKPDSPVIISTRFVCSAIVIGIDISVLASSSDEKRDSLGSKSKSSKSSDSSSRSFCNIDSRSPKKDDKASDGPQAKPLLNGAEIKSPKKDDRSMESSVSAGSVAATVGPVASSPKPKPVKEQELFVGGAEVKSNMNSRKSVLYKDVVEKLNSDSIKPLDISTASINLANVDESPKKNSSRETMSKIGRFGRWLFCWVYWDE